MGIVQTFGQAGQAWTFLGFRATFACGLRAGKGVQHGVQAQARDQANRFREPLAVVDQFDHRIAAITDHDDLTLGLPAAHFRNGDGCPFGQGAVPRLPNFLLGLGR
jgi:hypothetical protein